MQTVPILVSTPTELAGLMQHLLASPRLAVDTESNSFYAYHERLCVLQISTAHADYVIDTFPAGDLSPLAEVFANPGIEKIFHAAQEDIRLLKRTLGCPVENIFDTMVAARIAGWKEVGLAACLKNHFHVILNKKLQRSDWGRRPLSREQIEYAAKDTHWLVRLRELLHQELLRLGRLEEALEQFNHIAQVETPRKEFDPEAFRKLKGARELDPRGLAVLRELFLYREERARAINRPVFMVLPDLLLIRLGKIHPQDHAHLKSIPGVTPFILDRHGRGILEAVARGKLAEPVGPPESKAQRLFDGRQTARYERLRAWRIKKAAERGVESDVILSNTALKELALLDGSEPAQLEGVPGLGPHKRSLYGAELLDVLKHKK